MRLVVAGLVFGAIGLGQALVDSDQVGAAEKYLTVEKGEQRLACTVAPVRPYLSYLFRIQSGYFVRVPMKQFSGSGHKWVVLFRVRPEGGGSAAYFASPWTMPDVPKTKQEIEVAGMFLVGEGRYRVDWMLGDDQNRYCRKSWTIDAKLDGNERGMNLGLPPGAIREVSLRHWSSIGHEPVDARPIRRLTVLLHAAPILPRRTRLGPQDRGILLGSLVSLLETLPAQSVRLVVFNLDQQKELFRQDVLTPEAYSQVSDIMRNIQLQLVDYHVLQNRMGHIGLLTGLLTKELNSPEPSDAVVFLGPTSRYGDKVPDLQFDETSAAQPRLFYLQFKTDWDRGRDFPDSIDFAMKKVRGKTVIVHNPDEFAKAIKQIEVVLSGEKHPGAPGS